MLWSDWRWSSYLGQKMAKLTVNLTRFTHCMEILHGNLFAHFLRYCPNDDCWRNLETLPKITNFQHFLHRTQTVHHSETVPRKCWSCDQSLGLIMLTVAATSPHD